jgi:hypothetical protein
VTDQARLLPEPVRAYMDAVTLAQNATAHAIDLEQELRQAIALDDGTPDAQTLITGLRDRVHLHKLAEGRAHDDEEQAYEAARVADPDLTFALWFDLHPLPA